MAHDWLDHCLRLLAEAGGSDLHLKVGSVPRIRVNGSLEELPGQPDLEGEAAEEVAAAVLGGAAPAAGEADCAYTVEGLGRFRVNLFRQRGMLSIVMRLVPAVVPTLEELGLPPVVGALADEPRGLVLVTGPTGSGKTTTLGAMVDRINGARPCHVITIEDPIEVLHDDRVASIDQREVGMDTADFPTAMRAALRQDPDVILVGEMRDIDTVRAALGAAETGHLVLSTLHTTDAKETLNRIVDFFPPEQQDQVRLTLAGSLRGTVGQRLVPTADGAGRVPAVEVMVVTGRVQQCIVDPANSPDLAEIVGDGEFYGMQTFDQSLAGLYEAGRIDLRAALAAATNPHDLTVALRQAGLLAGTAPPSAGTPAAVAVGGA
ncbi:MAG: type IV pilus twitching motility protein PilT [Acidimicrobiales bacterium]